MATGGAVHGRSLVTACLRPWSERLLDVVAPRPGDVVVDAPCDLGVMASLLSRRVPLATVVAVDAPATLSTVAAEGAPRGRGALLVAASAAALPLADGSVDVAVSLLSLAHLPDPEAALAELARVVRPDGGRLACAVWGRRERVPHEALVADLLAGLVGHPVPEAERGLSLGDDAAAARLVAAAGPGARAVRLHDVLRFDGPQHAWQALVQERPVGAVVAGGGAELALELYRELERALQPFCVHDATVRLPAEAVVVVAGPVAA